MNLFLILAFLFFIGSMLGWIIEVIFRRFFSSANPERKWINPGFCTGPYIPLYGMGLCALYLIASIERNLTIENDVLRKAVLFVIMAISMTAIEYIAGIISLKIFKVRLWDYSGAWGNIQGIICPKFSLAWALLGALYYFLIHPYILNALEWLSRNLAFSFVVGMFFGIFIIDIAHSAQIISRLKKYADENDIIVKYETLKANIRQRQDARKQKHHFFFSFRSERPLSEYLHEMTLAFEARRKKTKKEKESDDENK